MSYTFNITGSSARRLLRFQELIVCVFDECGLSKCENARGAGASIVNSCSFRIKMGLSCHYDILVYVFNVLYFHVFRKFLHFQGKS